jgi:hypothetical protein
MQWGGEDYAEKACSAWIYGLDGEELVRKRKIDERSSGWIFTGAGSEVC